MKAGSGHQQLGSGKYAAALFGQAGYRHSRRCSNRRQFADKMSERNRGQLRNRMMGFVYQFHHLLPEFTALENVAMPLLIGGSDVAAAKRRAGDTLEKVGLEHRLEHKPGGCRAGTPTERYCSRWLTGPGACWQTTDRKSGSQDGRPGLSAMLELNRMRTSLLMVP